VPEVKIDITIQAPVDRVWATVAEIERYQESMETVRSVKILEQHGEHHRRAAWSVLLKGSVLQWEEEEELDPENRLVAFKQIRGDLEYFDGQWRLEELGPEKTRVIFEVSFEIGIPMLAEMLNPVAQRSLQENCTEMLRGIERAVSVA
jgi:ribosome-associated toxin RatA of RatAB toxin-antitoxin module